MMYYLQSNNTSPYYNLALEQHVFDNLDRAHSYFMLWQNHNSIIVGKHQNTIGEINSAYVKEHGITVARRLSGGGAVYHDMGNLNFTFITDKEGEEFDFSTFCRPVAKALGSMGAEVEISGRNDMTIDGKKFSGNAMYMKEGRLMHHGTLLFDSDLQVVGNALRVSKDKIESKGLKSVRSRVTNIKPYLPGDVSLQEFWQALLQFMIEENDMQPYALTAADEENVQRLRDEVYSQWKWNYGVSPACTVQKERRIEGCGKVEVFLNVAKESIIEEALFYGDYFGNGDSSELGEKLKGCALEEGALRKALEGTDIGYYFNNLSLDDFLSIMLI